MKTNLWTREEHILAFNLYNQIPFGTIHVRNPKIVDLGKLLGRSTGSVSRKLANFARLDPALQQRGIRGLPHGAKGEEEVWSEFAKNPERLVFESQRLLAQRLARPLEALAEIDPEELIACGENREAFVFIRVNQAFFRRRVISAYNSTCCVTGLRHPALLVASHIIPWAKDKKNRLNVRNGLCLNALHDRAFDRGLMWIDKEFRIRFRGLKGKAGDPGFAWLTSFEGASLILPTSFQPDPALLEHHAKSHAVGA